MKLLLQLKHWQLFLILFLIYWMGRNSYSAAHFAMLLNQSLFWGWLWAIVIYGHKQFEDAGFPVKSTVLFSFNIAYLFVFVLLVTVFRIQDGEQQHTSPGNGLFWYLALGYFIFAALQTIWFTARILSILENDGNFAWGTTIIYCILIVIPVVSVWVIQPEVNKWFQTNRNFPEPETD
jgi:hypothetical protein